MSGLFDQITNYSPPLLTAGQVNYKGTWSAAANTPTLTSPPAATSKGDYYVVSAAGTQFGITFAVGDWIISNGTAWEKVDLTDSVSSVFGRTGAVVSANGDYTASQVTNVPAGTISSTNVQDAINELSADIATAQNVLDAYVTNADSVTITKGQVVYAFGATGNRMSVKLANNSADATSAKTVGVVLDSSIAAGNPGYIRMVGVVDGLNLGAYNDGDTLYLGATAGSVTSTKPYAPNHLVYVGIVERANNGNGQLYVRVQNGYELDEIHDVQITSAPDSGALLVRDATNSLWKAARLTAGTNIAITNADASVTVGITGIIAGTNGGTGVNNGANTITIAGNVTHAGAFTQTFTATANTSLTLPVTGTLATLAGSEALSNKTITASSFSGTTVTATNNGNNFVLKPASLGSVAYAQFVNSAGSEIGYIGYGTATTAGSTLSVVNELNGPVDILSNFAVVGRFSSTGLAVTGKTTSTATTVSPATSGTTQGGPLRLAASNGTALDFGAYAASPYGQWIQAVDTTNLANTYPLILNPNGGNVGIGATSPASILHLKKDAAGNGVSTTFEISTGTKTNWRIGCQNNVDNGFEITPSTAAGGLTFSTPVASFTSTGLAVTGALSSTGNYNVSAGFKLTQNTNAYVTPEDNVRGAVLAGTGAAYLMAGGSVIAGATSTGLAVTGALSATGNILGSGTYVGISNPTYPLTQSNGIGAAFRSFAGTDIYGVDFRRWTGTGTEHSVAYIGQYPNGAGGFSVGIYYDAAKATNTQATTRIVSIDQSGLAVTGALSSTTTVSNGSLMFLGNQLIETSANSNYSIAINYSGYNQGATQFRDLEIYNGKNGQIAKFVGSSGNVGIGTTSPSSRLTVADSVGGAGMFFVANKGVGATGSGAFGLSYNTVNYTPGSASSSIYWDGGTGWFTLSTSSRKYKRNIVAVTDEQLDKALLLKPSYYQRNEHDYFEYGFIAEEVNEVGLDEFVTRVEGEISGLNYEKMVTLAIGLAQRQAKENANLVAELQSLRQRVAALESN